MPVDEAVDEQTHEVLEEELSEYDREAAERTAEAWVADAPDPSAVSESENATFEIFETDDGGYQWRLVGSGDRVIACSGSKFADPATARDAVTSFKSEVAEAPITA